MSASLEAKKAVVEEIKGKFETCKSAVVVDYLGLNVAETTELRAKFREAGVDYKVYKNNLTKRAIQGTQFESLSEVLSGPNAIAFCDEDAVAPARIIKEFADDHDKLELKAGFVEGEFFDTEKITKLASIPSRETLIAKFMGSIKSPLNNFVYVLSSIKDQKEEA